MTDSSDETERKADLSWLLTTLAFVVMLLDGTTAATLFGTLEVIVVTLVALVLLLAGLGRNLGGGAVK